MKLESIHLLNFRQHADSLVRFGAGLHGIIGPNGGGKSTILEAVAFALYGTRATRGNKETLRWSGAPATRKAEVALYFEVNGTRYMVERSETAAVLDAGGDKLAVGHIAVTAEVERILGLTYDEWASTYMTAQKDLMRLSSMGGVERATFLRRVMGVERLDAAVKAQRAAVKDARARREGMAAGLGEREPLAAEHLAACNAEMRAREAAHFSRSQEGAHRRAETNAQRALAASAERRAEHDRLTRERERAQRDAEQGERDVQRLAADLEQAEAAAARVAEREPELAALPGLRRELEDAARAEVATFRRKATEEDIGLAEEGLADAQSAIDTLRAAPVAYDESAHDADLEAHRAASQVLAVARADMQEQAGIATAKSNAHFDRRDALREQASVLEDVQGGCPTCLTPLTPEALAAACASLRAEADREEASGAAALDDLDAAQERASERIRVASERVDALSAALRDHDNVREGWAAWQYGIEAAQASAEDHARRLALLRERLGTLPAGDFDPARADEVRAEVARLEALGLAQAADQATCAAGRMAFLRGQAKDAGSALTEARYGVGVAAREMEALAFDPAAHAALEQDAERARQAREEARATLSAAEAEVRAAEARHGRAQAALAEHDSRAQALADATEALRVATLAAERLDAFRTAQVAGIRPELEELVSGFVATLTDGRYESAELDETFGVTLFKSGVRTDVISGGEEDVVALALRLATSHLISQRAGVPLQMMILDEPFGSQDEQRRRNILDLVARRLRGMFEQVVLVSHHADVEQAVDHAILVDVDPERGCSVVRMEDFGR